MKLGIGLPRFENPRNGVWFQWCVRVWGCVRWLTGCEYGFTIGVLVYCNRPISILLANGSVYGVPWMQQDRIKSMSFMWHHFTLSLVMLADDNVSTCEMKHEIQLYLPCKNFRTHMACLFTSVNWYKDFHWCIHNLGWKFLINVFLMFSHEHIENTP